MRKASTSFQDQVAGLEPAARPAMLLHTWLAYEKQFRNLQLQEQRLSNYAARLKTELEQRQKQRDRKEAEDFARAAVLYTAVQKAGKPYNPEDDGFEFSLADLQDYLRARRAATASQNASGRGAATSFRAVSAAEPDWPAQGLWLVAR